MALTTASSRYFLLEAASARRTLSSAQHPKSASRQGFYRTFHRECVAKIAVDACVILANKVVGRHSKKARKERKVKKIKIINGDVHCFDGRCAEAAAVLPFSGGLEQVTGDLRDRDGNRGSRSRGCCRKENSLEGNVLAK